MSWWNDPTPKHAFYLSWISALLTFVAAVSGLLYFVASGSALCLVFGLENIVDFFSSIVVIWRFYCPGTLDEKREQLLQKREKRASMAISFILMLLGICVIGAAANDLSSGAEDDVEMKLVIILALLSVFIFGALTVVKFHYANKLDSASLNKDGQCSLIGTVLAIGLFVTSFFIEKAPGVWWLDPVFAIACGVAAFLLGAQAVYVASRIQGLPIFTISWWFVSQGDDMDERKGTSTESGDSEPDHGENVEMKASNNDDTPTHLSEVV